MDTALLDAAFRLVSHSITSIEARFPALTTEEGRLAELGRRFPQAGARAIQEAFARARRLEELAIDMADAARNQSGGPSGPALDAQALAERCPGFSGESYTWAINDGFSLTRK